MVRLSAVALAALLALPAAAQDPQTGDPRVPSLTPREFEIRGEVRVALPQIERQPLSGFGPPPRVFVLDDDRAALTSAYDPSLDALPPLALAPPEEPEADLPVARALRAEGTYGADAGRTGRFDLAIPVASGALTADVDYDGVGWSTDLTGLAYDRLRAQGEVQTGGRVRLGIGGGFYADRYGMPGVREEQNLSGNPLRRLTRATGHASLEGIGASPFGLRVSYAADRFGPADDADGIVLGSTQSGAQVDARAHATLLGRLRVDGAAGTAGLDGGLGEDAQYAAGGGAFVFTAETGAEIVLGARALAYRVAAGFGDGEATAVAPIVNVSFPLGPTARLFASNDPQIVARGLGDVALANPFVDDRPVVAPDLRSYDARAGAELTSPRVRLRGFAHYTQAPTYLIFERGAGGMFVEGYETVRIQGITAETTVLIAGGVSLDAGVTFRDGEIDDNGGSVPFLAPFVARAGLQVPFRRGRVGITFYREGERPTDRFGGADAPSFALLSADARLDLTRSLALLFQADRLAGAVEEWPGYRLPGNTLRGGVRLTL